MVADFGIARAVEGAADEEALTRTGISLGTVGYMSPEQASGKRAVDRRSDVYALGCVLYEMLTGERAFPGRTVQAVMARQLTEAPPTASVLRRGVPEAVERVLQRALQPNPADRHGTAAELRAELVVTHEAGGPRARQPPLGLMRRPAVAGVGLLILGALAYAGFVYAGGGTAEPGVPEIRSLAVLPLENHAPDPEAEQYFADGMTEALTSELGQISALTVISRMSASRYRATDKPIPQIAQELGVEGLIEGSVFRAGDEVRIDVRLVHGPTRRDLWSESYERDLRDVLALQRDVARAIAEEIEVTVAPEEEAHLASARPVDPAAYEAYLRGRDYMRRSYREDDFRSAIRSFERAVALDPQFAPAHARVARVHVDMYWQAYDRTEERLARATEAIDRAHALDPDDPETHLALGFYHYHGHLAYEEAVEEFELVLEARPSDAEAVWATGVVRRRQGRMAEAADYMERAVELDPRSAELAQNLAETYQLLRRFEEAERTYDRGLALQPDRGLLYQGKAHLYLAWGGQTQRARQVIERGEELLGRGTDTWITYRGWMADLLGRRYGSALERLREHREEALESQFFYYPNTLLTGRVHRFRGAVAEALVAYDSAHAHLVQRLEERPDDERLHGALALALSGLGRKGEAAAAARRAEELMPPSREAWRGTWRVEEAARVYARIGDPEAALDRIEYLLTNPSDLTTSLLRLDQEWEPLRDHPRYQELLE